MGIIRQSKPKKANVEKLNLYLNKIKDGKQTHTRPTSKGGNDCSK